MIQKKAAPREANFSHRGPLTFTRGRDHHVYLCGMRMLDGQILGSQRQEQVAREEKLLKDVRKEATCIRLSFLKSVV